MAKVKESSAYFTIDFARISQNFGGQGPRQLPLLLQTHAHNYLITIKGPHTCEFKIVTLRYIYLNNNKIMQFLIFLIFITIKNLKVKIINS